MLIRSIENNCICQFNTIRRTKMRRQTRRERTVNELQLVLCLFNIWWSILDFIGHSSHAAAVTHDTSAFRLLSSTHPLQHDGQLVFIDDFSVSTESLLYLRGTVREWCWHYRSSYHDTPLENQTKHLRDLITHHFGTVNTKMPYDGGNGVACLKCIIIYGLINHCCSIDMTPQQVSNQFLKSLHKKTQEEGWCGCCWCLGDEHDNVICLKRMLSKFASQKKLLRSREGLPGWMQNA